MQRGVILLCSIFYFVSSFAFDSANNKDDDNSNPDGCRNVGYKFELKTVHIMPLGTGERQSLYMIFNNAMHPVNLYQLKKDNNTRDLYMNHTIAAQKWAVLATSELDLKFTCAKPLLSKLKNKLTNEFGDIIDCSDVLRICEFDKVRFGLNNRGNFWLSENFTRNAGVKAIVHYGIIPYVR